MNSRRAGLQALESRTHLSVSATAAPTTPHTGLIQTTAHLSQGRAFFSAATVGNKMLFGGGETATGMSDVVDIYNVKTGLWSTAHLSQARFEATAVTVGHKVLFAGGTPDAGGVSDVVDVYDDSTGQWSVTHLPHSDTGLVLAVGSKVVFAGGRGQAAHLSTADIYDSQTGQWSTVNLPLPSFTGGALIIGHYAFFGADGGANVLDALTGRWSAVALPDVFKLGVWVGSKLISGGEGPTVNTYDIYTGKMATGQLSQSRGVGAVETLGGKVIYAGGLIGLHPIVDTVDVYDTITNQWSVTTLSVERLGMAAAVLGTQAFFAGGNGGGGPGFSDVVDIFTDSTPTPILDGFIVRGDETPGAGTASVTLRNTGDNALAGPFTVTIYGARPGRRSVVLGTVDVRRALRVGDSRSIAVNLAPPAGTTLADYHLAAATDAGAGEAIFAAELDLGHFTASLLPLAQVAQADKSTTFSITYHSPFSIDASTFDGNDIIVTGPNGFEAHAQFLSQTRGKRSTTRIATYAIHAAGRRWDPSDNGTYTIHLQDGQVMDTAGNAVPSDRLRSFSVTIPTASAAPATTAAVQRGVTPFQRERKLSDLLELEMQADESG
jgi:hypothetical protein